MRSALPAEAEPPAPRSMAARKLAKDARPSSATRESARVSCDHQMSHGLTERRQRGGVLSVSGIAPPPGALTA